MPRTIFIGSSAEALKQATQLAGLLQSPDLKVELWTNAFRPGYLTFHVIEERARSVSGAIFLAAPDDKTIFRGSEVKVPRTNVMIEFGYMCAMLGRERVVLCRYDDVELATDLAGYTYIPMGPFAAGDSVHGDAIRQLLEWSRYLPAVTDGIDYCRVMHGYTGNWDVRVVFDRWRNIELSDPNFVEVAAKMELYIPRDGVNGYGCIHGDLTIQVQECTAEFKVTDRISAITCEVDGSISFHSEMHNRQQIQKHGPEPQEDGFREEIKGPYAYVWKLVPHGTREMRGHYIARAGNSVRSRAQVFAKRVTR